MPALSKTRCTAALMVAASLLAGLAGCRSGDSSPGVAGTPAAVPVGSSERTITVGGQARTFHLYRPAQLAQPAALVVMLHGGADPPSTAVNATDTIWRFFAAHPKPAAR